MKSDKILIIGLGNTILSDDAAGIIVAKGVAGKAKCGISFVEASYAGWRLIDILNGYKRAIIIDSIVGSEYNSGECYKVDISQITSLHLSSAHGMGLNEAIGMARMQGFEVPERISLYAVGVGNPFEFGENVSEDVMARIPGIVEQIITEEKLDV